MAGPTLLIAMLLSIAVLMVLILRFKAHAIFALLAAGVVLGLAAGMEPLAIVSSFQKGMGNLLGSISLLVGGGMILGRMIEVSGGGKVMATALIKAFGREKIPWAFLVAAYLIAIPVFYDAAFLALIPLVLSLSRETKKSVLLYALPLLSGLTATFGLVPPSPGPAAVAELLGADLGKVILYGLILSVPMSVVGGVLYGGWIGRRIFVPVPESFTTLVAKPQTPVRSPTFRAVLGVVLLPVVLISIGTSVSGSASVESSLYQWISFFGSPLIALVISAVAALIILGKRSGLSGTALLEQTGSSLNAIGSMLFIIGCAGSYKQVIVDCGAGPYFAQFLLQAQISPLLLAFLVGATLRLIIGSGVASIVTAGGLVAPLTVSFPQIDPALMVMAVAIGGSFTSHVNDSGFWMVKEYCGMSVPDTLKSYTVMKSITSLTGLASLLLLQRLV